MVETWVYFLRKASSLELRVTFTIKNVHIIFSLNLPSFNFQPMDLAKVFVGYVNESFADKYPFPVQVLIDYDQVISNPPSNVLHRLSLFNVSLWKGFTETGWGWGRGGCF